MNNFCMLLMILTLARQSLPVVTDKHHTPYWEEEKNNIESIYNNMPCSACGLFFFVGWGRIFSFFAARRALRKWWTGGEREERRAEERRGSRGTVSLPTLVHPYLPHKGFSSSLALSLSCGDPFFGRAIVFFGCLCCPYNSVLSLCVIAVPLCWLHAALGIIAVERVAASGPEGRKCDKERPAWFLLLAGSCLDWSF